MRCTSFISLQASYTALTTYTLTCLTHPSGASAVTEQQPVALLSQSTAEALANPRPTPGTGRSSPALHIRAYPATQRFQYPCAHSRSDLQPGSVGLTYELTVVSCAESLSRGPDRRTISALRKPQEKLHDRELEVLPATDQ